jgi:hypothetical protein
MVAKIRYEDTGQGEKIREDTLRMANVILIARSSAERWFITTNIDRKSFY